MSRLAKKAIIIPDKVNFNQLGDKLIVKGAKGECNVKLHPNITVKIENNNINVVRNNEEKLSKALQGTIFVLINNSIKGVTEGFVKQLQLHGVGYKAKVAGDKLELNLGKSHLINYKIPAGIKIETPTQTEITISGIDKQLVGQVAANIREFRSPEPYKGKGVRYLNEVIVLKETKKSKK